MYVELAVLALFVFCYNIMLRMLSSLQVSHYTRQAMGAQRD